jgi:hypothetical protein
LRTFNDVSLEKHKETCIKVIKHCLKQYYKLDSEMFPQSGAVKTETVTNTSYLGDIFCIKLDIDRAIAQLPLQFKKIVIMHFIVDFPIHKLCPMMAMKYRVDAYRPLNHAFELLYEYLGLNWLRD